MCRQEVLYVLDNPKSMSPLSEEEYAYILSGGGKMVGVFTGGRLVHFARYLSRQSMTSILVMILSLT